MKKINYITPAIEVKRISVPVIMAGSDIVLGGDNSNDDVPLVGEAKHKKNGFDTWEDNDWNDEDTGNNVEF